MDSLPPFPDDVPTHPLLVVDYALVQAGDKAEVERLWAAATTLRFWYLKSHGTDDEVRRMFEMGEKTMALPLEEKMLHEQDDDGNSFGYRMAAATAIDATGTPGSAEFINVAKDNTLGAWPDRARPLVLPTVDARMESTVRPFVEKTLALNMTILDCEARVICSPPAAAGARAIGPHTDFGSLSVLHNSLGGLQVFVPGAQEWQYVKPVPGYAICNIGDALTIFSGGLLRSSLHRVITPPGLQGTHTRFFLVLFTRPANSVVLRSLEDLSPVVAGAVATSSDPSKYKPGVTAFEWFTRRVKNQRVKNRKGSETWIASRGNGAYRACHGRGAHGRGAPGGAAMSAKWNWASV
ncbi:Alternative oxidase [Mycena chlorophos]|uniref:Alternative oxidase n=1 Tax=Mycena chlorophos TaxID=658473 RepID=A0A8H6VQZ5_MYCCL|nr:Alternative oxidase [Mycena chlorophos]